VSDKVTIKIPRPLYNRIQEIVSGTGFNSVTEFVVYVMRDLASVDTRHKGEAEGDSLTREEVELIRTRLRNLGYLD